MNDTKTFERKMFISGRNLETVAAWHGLSREALLDHIRQAGPDGLVIDTGSGRSPIFSEVIDAVDPTVRPFLAAIDTDPACVDVVQETIPPGTPKVTVENVSGLDMCKKFGDNSASLIIASFLFPYWNTNKQEGNQFIDELYSTLKPGGKALLAPLYLQPGPSARHDAREMTQTQREEFFDHLKSVERDFVEELYKRQKAGEINLSFRYALDELDQIPMSTDPRLTEVSPKRYPHWYDHYGVGLAVEITKSEP